MQALRKERFGCTEYAIARLTGINVLKEFGLKATQVGFENVVPYTRGKCSIRQGTVVELLNGRLDRTILRIRPYRKRYLHSVIVWKYDLVKSLVTIEDQESKRQVPVGDLIDAWEKTGRLYMKCVK